MDKKMLEPCPFCGGEPRFERIGTSRLSCIVACLDCGASLESNEVGVRSGTNWNRRTLTSRVAELEGALADLLRDEKVLDDDSPRLEATRAKARAALKDKP
jgi:Lar family restriction alleviation protein